MPTKADLTADLTTAIARIEELEATLAGVPSVPEVSTVRDVARVELFALLGHAHDAAPEDRAGLAALLSALQSAANL